MTDIGANGQKVVLMQIDGRVHEVDVEIASIVGALNDGGCPTVASCSGHGIRHGNIALADGRELIVAANYGEGRVIDKAFSSITTPLKRGGGLKPVDLEAWLNQDNRKSEYRGRVLAKKRINSQAAEITTLRAENAALREGLARIEKEVRYVENHYAKQAGKIARALLETKETNHAAI